MTENGLIQLETADFKPKTQQIECVYKIYAILHSFYNKRTFLNFWRNSPKTLVNQELSFIFCQTCLHVDRLLKKMKQNSCGNSYVFTFYDICVFCKSPVLCGVVPRLYTQVK